MRQERQHTSRPIERHWRSYGAEAAYTDRPIAERLTGDRDIDAMIRAGFASECRRLDRKNHQDTRA